MTIKNNKILAVPTNVITGFLGVGKTSAIMSLIDQKPENETWAILVNEFGEIGIDGALFTGQLDNDTKVVIGEVPGGCMCCASQVPMQVALNQLLTKAKPDRLLIEPTGLGHPLEVLNLLSNEHYQDVIQLEQTITLVDARNLNDLRYTSHETFNQQIEMANIVVGNKTDLYEGQDKQNLDDYLTNKNWQDKTLYFTEHGQLALEWLAGVTNDAFSVDEKHHHHEDNSHYHQNQKPQTIVGNQPLPSSGILSAVNHGEGFESIGWRFAKEKTFDKAKLSTLLSDLKATRIKAVFNTNQGVYGYNLSNDGFDETLLNSCDESRIEIIALKVQPEWETLLLATIV